MSNIKTFRELEVWKKAHELVLQVYKITKAFPKEELFVLVSQLGRAAISIAANIVEGFRRKTLKDSVNFYHMADASLEELKYHLLLGRDLGYMDVPDYEKIHLLCEEVGKLLTRWIQSQERYLKS